MNNMIKNYNWLKCTLHDSVQYVHTFKIHRLIYMTFDTLCECLVVRIAKRYNSVARTAIAGPRARAESVY